MRRLAVATVLATVAIGGWAVGTGQLSYVITSGISMNPVYYQNDLVLVVKSDRYSVGQIAAYRGSAPGMKVLHRIIGGDGRRGFVLKGDNNQSTDPIYPRSDQIIGRAFLHVPKGGIWLKPLLSPSGLGMIGFLVIGGAAPIRTRREIPRGRRKKKVKAMSRQGGSWATVTATVAALSRLSLPLRAAAAAVTAVTGVAIVLGVLGWMKPVARAINTSAAPSMAFSYSAKVPRSPAYDGTTVTSPDPVFRKLADHIDVRMRYSGHPGTVALTTTASAESGWHTVISEAPAKSFASSTYETTTTLDLPAIDKRAKAAAQAIGLQPSPVTITLDARVTGADQVVFDAPLVLSLDTIQVRPADGKNSLVVTDASGKSSAAVVIRRISVFGHAIMTAARARAYAVFLLLTMLVAAGAIAFFARRTTPLRTRSQIERRYPQLLVPVEPMASPPGKPVVNVDNFPALVKLAERYGQMVLTWRRPDADDFVVRDEGITYRYRIPLDEPTLQNVEHIDRPPGAGNHRRKASSEVS